MARDYDRDDRDRDDRDEPRGPSAKQRVSAPSLMLILSAGLGLLFCIASLVTAFVSPDVVANFQQQMIDAQPAGAQKDELQKQHDQQKEQLRLNSPINLAQYGAATLLNLLALIGGAKMRGLSGYGLAMTGSIAAILPISGCCCLTTPIGIWALVVLLNPVVKQGFGVGRAEPVDDYDRRDDRDDRDRDDDRR